MKTEIKQRIKWTVIVLAILFPLVMLINHLDQNEQKERYAHFEREFGISYSAALADKANAEAIMMNHVAALGLASEESSARYYSLRKEFDEIPQPSSVKLAKEQLSLQRDVGNAYDAMYNDARRVYDVCGFLYEYDTDEPGALFPELPIIYPQSCRGGFLYEELN